MQVPFIEETEIEAEAYYLIELYEKKHGIIHGYTIPTDEIAELTLGYHLDIVDMNSIYPNFEVNGFIDFDNNTIAIHEGLEPTENPNYVGRYNFTIGHECGHHVFHKELILDNIKQEDLYSSTKTNKIL